MSSRFGLLALIVSTSFGCAGAGHQETGLDLGHAGNGGHDLSMLPSEDLSTADDGGDDLGGGGNNDLAGTANHDLAMSLNHDLAMSVSHDLAMATNHDLSTTSHDLASAPPDMTKPCGIVPQTGCPAGDKCTIGAAGNICEANGTQQNGSPCGTAGVDNCVAGDVCSVDSASASTAMCRQFCNTDANCTQPAAKSGSTNEPKNTAHCIITYSGTTQMACTFACNPVTAAGSAGCPTGLSCFYGGTSTIPELTDCGTPGTGTDGGNCTTTADCAAGYVCVGNGTTNVCRQVCRNGNANDCTAGGVFYDCFAPSGVTNPMFGFCCDFIAGC